MLKASCAEDRPFDPRQRRRHRVRETLRHRAEHRLALGTRLHEIEMPEQVRAARAQRQVDGKQVVRVVGKAFRAADRAFDGDAFRGRREHLANAHVGGPLARHADETGPVNGGGERFQPLKVSHGGVAQRQRERLSRPHEARLRRPQGTAGRKPVAPSRTRKESAARLRKGSWLCCTCARTSPNAWRTIWSFR